MQESRKGLVRANRLTFVCLRQRLNGRKPEPLRDLKGRTYRASALRMLSLQETTLWPRYRWVGWDPAGQPPCP